MLRHDAPRLVASGTFPYHKLQCSDDVRSNSMPVHYHEGLFPPKAVNWEALTPLLGPTAAEIARFDGLLSVTPNPTLLVNPLRWREAQNSSRIEGTRASIAEVFKFQASERDTPTERRDDAREVVNYFYALQKAEVLLETLPLCLRVLKQVHAVLMHGARGQHRSPGEIRTIPNWIGPPSAPIEAARFVPIGAGQLPQALSTWEKFMHADFPDRLVQLAILHGEFEALHPFVDGNGRLGRILIPLFLWQMGLTEKPHFYISSYLEARREQYYDGLLSISRDRDWTPWCQFFLEAVRAQAAEHGKTVNSILGLYEDLKTRLSSILRSRYTIQSLDWIFRVPVFRSSYFFHESGIPVATARRLLRMMSEHGILQEVVPSSGRRASIVAFSELLKLIEG